MERYEQRQRKSQGEKVKTVAIFVTKRWKGEFFICPVCDGTSYTDDYKISCKYCDSRGYIDWIKRVKMKKQEFILWP